MDLNFSLKHRLLARLLIGLAWSLGGGALLAFYLFLFPWKRPASTGAFFSAGDLWIDTGLSLLFFIQHSLMVRGGFRERLRRNIPEAFHAAFYAAASGLTLGTVMFFWRPGPVLWEAESQFLRGTVRSVFFLGTLGFVWGVFSLKSFDALGAQTILKHLKGERPPSRVFSAAGAYRWVRHPLYFFALILLWAVPVYTADRLLMNLLWTLWIRLGARLEERDLSAIFGETYRAYQKRTPMLVPSVVQLIKEINRR